METTLLLLPDVTEALRTDPSSVVELTEEMHAPDLADLTAALEDELAQVLVRTLPLDDAVPLLEALDRDVRVRLYRALATRDEAWAVDVAERMSPDERADLFGELSEEARAPLLARMERAESRDVRQLLAYPEDTAGALMTTNFVALPAEVSVARAIDEVRKSAAEMETIYAAYAVDAHGILVGAVSLRDLVVARAEKRLEDIMEPNVIAVEVSADQEEVARLIARYDLIALPVIDAHRKVVGIITVDDVVDVIEDEATEDVQRLGAVEPLERPYFQTGFWEFVRKRSVWLVILSIGGLITGSALRYFTDTFEQMAALMWLVPLIISCGGNAGSQSATLMTRALAIGEVRPGDFARVLGRELGIGLALGLSLSLIGMGRVAMWTETRSLAMVATVGLAISSVVTIGAVVGGGMPLALRRLGFDPAVSSTPFIASIVDVVGVMVYFEIATVLLF